MRLRLEPYRRWFDDYTAGFLTGDPDRDLPLRVKIAHTHEVMANMALLAASVGMDDQDRILAELMGLLHDVGRFRQYREYGTFRDGISVNHARVSVREVGRHRVLGGLPPRARGELVFAVVHHNALALPERPDPRRTGFARMLRDADKLDIWRVFGTCSSGQRALNATVDLDLAESPGYSPAVLERLRRGRMARLSDVRNRTDFKLLQVAWIYDLNLPAAFGLMLEQGHLAAISATLPQDPPLQAAVDRAFAYAAVRAAATPSRSWPPAQRV
jgi:hypothetical protein